MILLFLFGLCSLGMYCYGLQNEYSTGLLLVLMVCGLVCLIFGLSIWNQRRALAKRRREIVRDWTHVMARVTEIQRVGRDGVVRCEYVENGYKAEFVSDKLPYNKLVKRFNVGNTVSVYVRHYSFERITDEYFVDARF